MRSIDDDIKFHLSKQGWYLGEKEIEMVETIRGIDVIVGALNPNMLAYYDKGKIYIAKALAYYASLPQRRLAVLHEYAHIHLDLIGTTSHEKEYACDQWALVHMIQSNEYSKHELFDAIELFKNIVCEPETKTHPASQKRYKRLYRILKEYL